MKRLFQSILTVFVFLMGATRALWAVAMDEALIPNSPTFLGTRQSSLDKIPLNGQCQQPLLNWMKDDRTNKRFFLVAPLNSEVENHCRRALNATGSKDTNDLKRTYQEIFKDRFKDANVTPLKNCPLPNDEDGVLTTAKYFTALRRIDEGLSRVIDESAAINITLPNTDFDESFCGNSFKTHAEKCANYKRDCKKTNDKEFDELSKDATNAANHIFCISLVDKTCRHSGGGKGISQKLLANASPQLRQCMNILTSDASKIYNRPDVIQASFCDEKKNREAIKQTAATYPFLNGEELRKTINADVSVKPILSKEGRIYGYDLSGPAAGKFPFDVAQVKQATMAQLKVNRDGLRGTKKDLESAYYCLTGQKISPSANRDDCSAEFLNRVTNGVYMAGATPTKSDTKSKAALDLYQCQQSLIDINTERDKMTAMSRQGAETLGLTGLSLLTGLATAPAAAARISTFSTLARVGIGIGVVGAEATLARGSISQAYESCIGNTDDAVLTLAKNQALDGKSCPTQAEMTSHGVRKANACYLDSMFAVADSLSAGLATNAAKNISRGMHEVSQSKAAANTTAHAAEADTKIRSAAEAGEVIERRSHKTDLPPVKVTRLKEVNMAGTSDGLKVYKNRRENGETFESFDYVVDVPGKGPKIATAELPRDSLTGAIDANLPSGRKFLDLMLQNNQGNSYLAFLDVGNLGFVNRSFKSGMKGGDEYLKRVAHVIKSVGGDKITLVKLGGDEFAIVIHETDPKKAKQLMQNISDQVSSPDVHKVFKDEKLVRAEAVREKLYEKFPDADPKKHQAAMDRAFTAEEKQIIENKKEAAERAMVNSGDYKEALREASLKDQADTMESSFQKNRSDMVSSPEFVEAGNEFRKDFVPYSKETASIGLTEVGFGDTTETVLARAEDAATPMKIEGKVVMNQNATKQGGPAQDLTTDPKTGKMTRVAKPSYQVQVDDPVPAPKILAKPKPLRAIDPSLPRMTETEGREVGRYTKFSVVESTNEIGQLTYKLKKYVTLPDGTRKHIDYEVARNTKTGFIDGNTDHAKEFLNAIVSEKKNTTIIMGDAPELGKINYFKNKSADGDKYIEAVAKAVNEIKRGEDIAFKVKGSEFVIEVENASAESVRNITSRIQEAVKNSPEIQKIFSDQQKFLEKELTRNPGSADIKNQLANLQSIRRDIDLTTTVTKPGDTADTVLARTREDIRRSREQKPK